ncbi:glycoside hydrolase family protein [Wenyingzhuangia aestuarii]|uniref:glycosyl hydrolase family 28-related protein n=1 Tax=Wenyingzhuangia aestuarii TaxID=1647582 RepID=UPI001439525B|nr:glycosyl hydrolase family 28-related protein [Wenyingzhuangia aestuarii]NJB83675.1 hypothetical protein [Wenyingzhuangia aestuarii]
MNKQVKSLKIEEVTIEAIIMDIKNNFKNWDNTKLKLSLIIVMLMCNIKFVNAQYVEKMNPKGYRVDLQIDYNLVNDNAKNPQGDKLQKAIDDVARKNNGGIVYVPKGVYAIEGIVLKSNVHVLIEVGTVLKVLKESTGAKNLKNGKKSASESNMKKKSKSTNGVVFKFDAESSSAKGRKNKNSRAFIENVSVRGVNGPFVIDYHHLKSGDKQRAFMLKMVRNFLIENVDIKDNYTVYCGTSFGPSSSKGDVSDWEVSRPTDGLIRNYRHFRGSPGYGAIQCHGGQTVHFENIYTYGGVGFRLEVGANNKNVGVFDMSAKNVICEDGKIAVMMGPHSAKNGIVTVDGILAIGCVKAFSMGNGHVKKKAPDQTPGWFDSKSSVKNIHAIYGESAQVKGTSLGAYSNPKYLEKLKMWSDGKFFSGPSLGVISEQPIAYKVSISNVTCSSFPFEPSILRKETENRHDTKKAWVASHVGTKWMTNKGVTNEDYEIETPEEMKIRIQKLMEKQEIKKIL